MTRVESPTCLDAFKALADATPQVASICTGSAALAKAGLLDGMKTTTNKRAYAWATSQIADAAEYRWHDDPNDHPFAKMNGLSG